MKLAAGVPGLTPARSSRERPRANVAPRRGADRRVAIKYDVARIRCRSTGALGVRYFGLAPTGGGGARLARAVRVRAPGTRARCLRAWHASVRRGGAAPRLRARAGSRGPGPVAFRLSANPATARAARGSRSRSSRHPVVVPLVSGDSHDALNISVACARSCRIALRQAAAADSL